MLKLKKKKVEEKEDNELKEKLDILVEIFPLPRDILGELLAQCNNNVEQVLDLINSTTFN